MTQPFGENHVSTLPGFRRAVKPLETLAGLVGGRKHCLDKRKKHMAQLGSWWFLLD